MAHVFLTPAAEESRIDIWLHIASDNPDAADGLLERIDAKCQLYAAQPEMGDLRDELGDDIRYFPVGNYVVIYRATKGGIIVLFVIHGARDIPTVFRAKFDFESD